LSVFVVNRSETDALETTITLDSGQFTGSVQAHVINGPNIRAENSFDCPDTVGVSKTDLRVERKSFVYTFEPHSVTVLVCASD
jgi:alpha-N-arabinofuranosidase